MTAFVLVAALFGGAPAGATLLTISFGGLVGATNISTAASSYTAELTYDDAAAAFDADSGTAYEDGSTYEYKAYRSLVSFSFTSGEFSQHSVPDPANTGISVTNDIDGGSDLLEFVSNEDAVLILRLNGDYTVLSSADLPHSINLSDFPYYPSFDYLDSLGSSLTGTVQTLSVAPAVSQSSVPEPASWTMMIVGFGAIGAAMRRQRPRVRLA